MQSDMLPRAAPLPYFPLPYFAATGRSSQASNGEINAATAYAQRYGLPGSQPTPLGHANPKAPDETAPSHTSSDSIRFRIQYYLPPILPCSHTENGTSDVLRESKHTPCIAMLWQPPMNPRRTSSPPQPTILTSTFEASHSNGQSDNASVNIYLKANEKHPCAGWRC